MRLTFAFLSLLLWMQFIHAAEPSKVRALSFVLVAESRLPDADTFRSTLESRLKGQYVVGKTETDDEGVILLRIRGGTLMVGLIDAPLPKGQLDDLCANAWFWRQACTATAAHRAHITVSVLDTDLDALDASLLLTHAVASLMDGNAIASYWGASLQSREAFLRQAANIDRDRPPVWLWINFRVSNDVEKGFSLSTQGMENFGLREIEAKDVNRPGADVFSLLIGMSQYLISHGPVIKDGETIGASPALNIRVKQAPSYWRDGARVYRVKWPR